MLRIDLTTGDVVHEPQHLTSGELAQLCAVLAA